MRVRFLSAAHHDVTEAAQHYTTTNPEAGARFFAELDRTLALLAENPRIGHPADAGALAFALNRFPYDVITFCG